MVKILSLLIFAGCVLMCTSQLLDEQLEQMDDAFRAAIPYGDPDHNLKRNKDQLTVFCNGWDKEVFIKRIDTLRKGYQSIPIALDFVDSLSLFSDKPRWCANIDQNIDILHNIVDTNNKMKPIRGGLERALFDSKSCITKYRLGDVLCFLNKYVTEIIGTVDEKGKDIMRDSLAQQINFLNKTASKRSQTCDDWSKIPEPEEPHLKAISTMLLKSLSKVKV